MRFRYSVSFESDTQPVQTVRGELDKTDAEDACKSAAYLAFKKPPRGKWRSWVICIEQIAVATAEVSAEDVA